MTIHFTDNEMKLLKILIEADGYQSINAIVRKMGFSKRSVYSFISNISNKCLEQHIEPPRNVYRQGYFLPDGTKRQLEGLKLLGENTAFHIGKLSSQERQVFDLLLLFLGDQVTTPMLVEWENVSKNTILNDLSQLKTDLKPYKIKVVANQTGHQLIGSELLIRNYMQVKLREHHHLLSVFLNKAKTIPALSELISLSLMLNDWIQTVEKGTNKTYSDDMVLFLESYYSLVLHRMMNNRILKFKTFLMNDVDRNEMEKSNEYNLAYSFIIQFGSELVEYTDECYYLESLLLEGQLNTQGRNDVKKDIVKVSNAIVENFKQISGVAFKDEKQLSRELYIHLLSTYYRVKYHHQYVDGMVAKIRDDYPDVYTYTKISIYPFEKLSEGKLTENEIALIAIYFGAQVVRESQESKSALIVCSSGIGASRFLMAQLNKAFPDLKLSGPISKKQYQSMEKIKDSIVISTIPLGKLNRDVIKVDPILDENGLNYLQKQLSIHNVVNSKGQLNQIHSLLDVIADNADIKNISGLIVGLKEVLTFSIDPKPKFERGYQPMLSELVKPNTITFADSKNLSWETAIKLAAKPLLENKDIKDSYVTAMIESVKDNGPYINIGSKVALAHARPETGVNHLSMSVLKLNNSIDLVDSKHKIQLIFVLAAVDATAHLKALSELASLLSNKVTLQQLFETENGQEFMDVILRSEKHEISSGM
ncbi:BglG family transcription antiterminator [Lactiplantibacillus brownii]|uniref:BglG family transcription antiterminator n=1 Tax=Lactiplantibacillus brownii TaxID=3069269 RepID=UPI0038B2F3F1